MSDDSSVVNLLWYSLLAYLYRRSPSNQNVGGGHAF